MRIPDFADETLRMKKVEQLEARGVVFIDRHRAYIEQDVEVGEGTVLYPDVYLYRGTRVGANCTLQQGVHLFATSVGEECVFWQGISALRSSFGNRVTAHRSSRVVRSDVGSDTEIDSFSLIKDSRIGEQCHIGPHACVRDESRIGDHCEIGATEVARSVIGNHTKAKHGRYIGDAKIGEHCNIGAGTVFCNYDGKKKHRTILGNHVFTGSGTMLVAPLTMEDWSATGANTTLPKGTYEAGMLYYVKRGELIAKPNPLAPPDKRKHSA